MLVKIKPQTDLANQMGFYVARFKDVKSKSIKSKTSRTTKVCHKNI